MAGWTVLVWAAGAVIFVPFTSALLGWSAVPGAGDVVGNQDLVAWVLSAPGLFWIVAAGILVLAGTAVRYAGLFWIVSEDLEGRRPTVPGALLGLAPRLVDLLRLCGAVVLGGVLLSAPLAAGLWGIREVFLGAHDINYYLEVRPPAWSYAVGAAVAWALAWLSTVAWLVGRSLLAVPAWMDGHRPLGRALRGSWRHTAGGGGARVLWSLALAVGLWIAARAFLDGGLMAAAWTSVQRLAGATGSLRVLASVTAVVVGLTVVADAVVDFLGFSTAATVLSKAYYDETDLRAKARGELPGVVEQGGAALERIAPWLTTWRIGVVMGGLVIASLLGGGVLLERLAEPVPVAVVAHRGGPPPAPENTLAALERAVAEGADHAEIDVQLTGDGVPVVAHDVDLMRVAGDPRRIGEHDWSELRDVLKEPRGGAGAAGAAEDRRIATLGEFLDRARGRIGLEIELKYYGRDTALVSAVIREVRRRDMTREVAIMSLDLGAVRQVHRLAPEIRTGYAAAVAVGDLSLLSVDFLTVARSRATPELLRVARDRGIAVHVWTVNRAPEMAELIRRGVDGLVTDRPATAVQVRSELNDLPAAARLLLRFQPFRLDEGLGEG